MRSFLVGLCALVTAFFTVSAHGKQNLKIPYLELDQEIELDGQLLEPFWQKAAQIELVYENRPGDNIPAHVATTAYYFEDGANLYVGFVADDPNPELIQAFFNDRDQSFNDDQVSIMIDTFNDARRGYQFFVNPRGVQTESLIDDLNRDEDVSWDTIWYSAGHLNGKGYTVEMVLPLRSIRYAQTEGEQTWGIEFVRFFPRDFRYRFSSIKRPRGAPCSLCLLDKMTGFKKIEPTANFEWVPTLTLVENRTRDDVLNDPWQTTGLEPEAGVDIRWGVTQDIILNATINPDFSQVEVDNAQLAVNQTFSLFFPERRPFFLDGADYFNTPQNLVYTRNIADPDYGAKLAGKTGDHSYGAILARDTLTGFIIPGSQGSSVTRLNNLRSVGVDTIDAFNNFDGDFGDLESDALVLRNRYDFGAQNAIGTLLTHRSADNYHNTVLGVDGRYWLNDTDRIEFQLLSSDTQNPLDVQSEFGLEQNQDDTAYVVRYDHRSRNWRVFANRTEYGEDFRADLGFINRVDFSRDVAGANYTWWFEEGWLNQIRFGGDYDITFDQAGLQLEEELQFGLDIVGASQFQGNIDIFRRERFQSREVDIVQNGQTEATLLAGEFFETQLNAGFSFRPVGNLELQLDVSYGDRIDNDNIQLGRRKRVQPEIEWQIDEHLQANLRYVFNWLDVDDGELFHARLADLRLSYQFNLFSRLRIAVQHLDLTRNPALYLYDNVDQNSKSLTTQLVYSYQLNPKSVFFLGYSDNGFQDDSLQSIELDQQSFFAKFSYAIWY